MYIPRWRRIQLNTLDIGDGFVLKVTPADYDSKRAAVALKDSSLPVASSGYLSSVGAVTAAPCLPLECESGVHPVVLIQNVYSLRDIKSDPDAFFAELEVHVHAEVNDKS